MWPSILLYIHVGHLTLNILLECCGGRCRQTHRGHPRCRGARRPRPSCRRSSLRREAPTPSPGQASVARGGGDPDRTVTPRAGKLAGGTGWILWDPGLSFFCLAARGAGAAGQAPPTSSWHAGEWGPR